MISTIPASYDSYNWNNIETERRLLLKEKKLTEMTFIIVIIDAESESTTFIRKKKATFITEIIDNSNDGSSYGLLPFKQWTTAQKNKSMKVNKFMNVYKTNLCITTL